MPNVPTFTDLYDAGLVEMQSRAPQLTDTTEGSALDGLLGGQAAIADEAIAYALASFAEQFVDTATGSALDALASDRFGLARKAAVAAVGVVRFTRSATTPTGGINIPLGTTVSATVDGETVSFETTAAGTIPDGETTVDVAAECTETGAAGNVAAGVIDSVDSAIPDDPDITVNNPARFTGGDAQETDSAFRARIRRYYSTVRRGTVEALKEGALGVAGVSFATVDESSMAPADGAVVYIYVGDPDARSNATLAALVAAEIESWRAAGVNVQVVGCTRAEMELELTVTHVQGADTATLDTLIRAAVIEGYTDLLDPGERLRFTRVSSKVICLSDSIVDCTVASDDADAGEEFIDPSVASEALRVVSGDLAITFVEEA